MNELDQDENPRAGVTDEAPGEAAPVNDDATTDFSDLPDYGRIAPDAPPAAAAPRAMMRLRCAPSRSRAASRPRSSRARSSRTA